MEGVAGKRLQESVIQRKQEVVTVGGKAWVGARVMVAVGLGCWGPG